MNHHPPGMFEIMADNQDRLITFYQNLFGWKLEKDSSGFAYIHFSPPHYPVLGGIGQAKKGVPGWEKGTAFYIQVESVATTLDHVADLGGKTVVFSTSAPPYTFGMFHDPEGNLIGLIEPFAR